MTQKALNFNTIIMLLKRGQPEKMATMTPTVTVNEL